MNTHWFLVILQQYGLPTAFVTFFIWRDWKREQSMTNSIQELNKEMRDVLKDLVIKCTAALVDNTNAMREFCLVLKNTKDKNG